MELNFLFKTGVASGCELTSLNEEMQVAGFICYTPANRCKK